jgi:general secretion pathway protein G
MKCNLHKLDLPRRSESTNPATRRSALDERHQAGRAGGFTLIELLLVLVILGILAAIVIPKFAGRTEQARLTAAKTQISSFCTALDAFEVDNGYYPKGQNGLNDLVEQPRDAQNWHGPYLQDIPKDPWGNDYIYTCPGRHNSSSYDIMSMGPDKRQGGDDDITNWKQEK